MPLPNATILYAEDDENDVFLMQRVFKKLGLTEQLQVASNGQEILDFLNEALASGSPARLPRLILLDLKMPRLSGLETLEKIRLDPRLNDIPVVILTSSVQASDTEKAGRLGATAYLVKAPALASLTETVSDLCRAFLNGPVDSPVAELRHNCLLAEPA